MLVIFLNNAKIMANVNSIKGLMGWATCLVLVKNLRDFLCSIDNLNTQFTFIMLSEVWGSNDTIKFYDIPGYVHVHATRDKRIGLFIYRVIYNII